jgi:hypothetical protein
MRLTDDHYAMMSLSVKLQMIHTIRMNPFYQTLTMKNKENNTSDPNPKNVFLSEREITEQEFLNGIQAAENGLFYTVHESMKQFENWLREREKR